MLGLLNKQPLKIGLLVDNFNTFSENKVGMQLRFTIEVRPGINSERDQSSS